MYKSTELTTKYTTKFGIPPRPLLAFLVWAPRSHIESLWKSSDSKTSSIAYNLLAFLRFTENFGFHLRIFCDYVSTATTSPPCDCVPLRLRYFTFTRYCDLILYRGFTVFTVFSDLRRFLCILPSSGLQGNLWRLAPLNPCCPDIFGCWVPSLTHSVLYFIIYWSPPRGPKIQRLRLHSL
jgi:hypothetical protein